MAAVLALAVFLVTTLSPVDAQSPRQWRQVKFPEHGIAAEFPAEPKTATPAPGQTQWMVELDNGYTAYLVTTSTITAERLRTAGSARVLEDSVDGGLNKFPGARVHSRTTIELGGNPGRQFVASIDVNGTVYRLAARVVLVQTRVYVATAIMRESTMDQAEMDRFLRSLGLISG